MGHGLHSIKQKNAKGSLLRQSNMAAAAARSQRLKHSHGRETTAAGTTTVTWNWCFFSQHSDGRTAFFSIAMLARLLYQQNCFPDLGMKRFSHLCEEFLIFESRSLRRFNRANNALWNLWRLFIVTVIHVENKSAWDERKRLTTQETLPRNFKSTFPSPAWTLPVSSVKGIAR